jgi:hypothetical protein
MIGPASAMPNAIGLSSVAFVARATSAPAASYLLSDDLEYADNATASTPGGWSIVGSPTFGYATAPNGPLAGSYSLAISGFGGDTATTKNFTASADTWVYFRFRINSLSATQRICTFFNSASSQTANCYVLSTGAVRILAGPSGSTVQSGADTLSAATTYHIWLHYRPGPGGIGATMEAYRSTDGLRGSPVVQTTSGTGFEAATSLSFGPVSSGPTLIWDEIRVSSSPIGNNPL